MNFGEILAIWYHKNRRDLPWRNSRDPYKIWLSEVILQQTRVQQGLPYYTAFVKKYPTVNKLASAPESAVLKLWQGLGYYSRARNLHAAAKMVVKDFGGKFPDNYKDLLKLKGVGDYTAAAISSFCFDEVQAVVDGNVYRVLSRVFGISTPIDSVKGKKEFRELAQELISKKDPATFNQAVMEFGALQCVPSNPDCEKCPFLLYCEARKKKKIPLLPVKEGKTKVRDRYFYYLVIEYKGQVYLKERREKDIWQGLHDFPLIETEKKISSEKLIQLKAFKSVFNEEKMEIEFSEEYKHILSHQRLHVQFVSVNTKKKPVVSSEWMAVSKQKLKDYAVPVLIEKYWKTLIKKSAK
jgi:A/G-specific adenine glycosylase